MIRPLDLIKKLHTLNVGIELEGKNLRLSGNVDKLPSDYIEEIKLNKAELIQLLEGNLAQKDAKIPISKKTADSFPLTKSQEDIWFLCQLENRNKEYNILYSAVLSGGVNINNLELAVNNTIQGIPALRTVFNEENGVPFQRVKNSLTIAIKRNQLVKGINVSKAIMQIETEMANTEFDLSNGPLITAFLTEIDEGKAIFSIAVHHLVSDGWSIQLILNSIASNYCSQKLDKQGWSETNDVKFSDFVNWKFKDTQLNRDKAINFWKKEFTKSDGPGVTFPSCFKNNFIRKGERCFYSFDESQVSNVIAYCKNLNITPFTFYFSLFNVLLYKYNNKNDFFVGVPFSGREKTDLRKTVGLIANVIPVKTTIEGTISFKELFIQTLNKQREIGKYQNFPIGEIRNSLKEFVNDGNSNLFNVLFAFQNFQMRTENSGLNLGEDIETGSLDQYRSENRVENVGSKFDISFQMGYSLEGKYMLEIEYLTNRYSSDRIDVIFESFNELINSALNDDALEIAAVEILSVYKKKTLLEKTNALISPILQENIADYLTNNYKESIGDRIAVYCDNQKISYKELEFRSNCVAAKIQASFGAKLPVRVAIMLERNINAVVSILGVLKSGHTYVPIDVDYPIERINLLLDDAKPKLVVLDSKGAEILKKTKYISETLDIDNLTQDENVASLEALGNIKDRTAYVIYTSGSTGKPKGVEVSHKNTLSLLNWAKKEYEHTDFDILYSPTSYCFDLSVFEYLFPLLMGKSIRILPNLAKFQEHLESEEGIFINTVPSVIKSLLDEEVNLKNVTAINMAGEPIPNWIKSKLDFEKMEVRNLYGPTEDTTYSTCYRFTNDEHLTIPIGKPIDGTNLFLTDRDGNIVPEGIEGEIWLTGESVAKGYLDRADITEKSFIENKKLSKYPIYKTGDIGKALCDGQIEFLGRKDHQVKLRGYRVELGEIKNVLETLEGVVQTEVLQLNEQLVCTWIGEEKNVEILKSLAKENLPSYMVPNQWFLFEDFPVNQNGKLDNTKLRELIKNQALIGTEYVAPSNDLEDQLKTIWEVLLEREDIGVRDQFFKVGGHSLIAIKMRHQLEIELEYKVTIEEIFDHPTIEDLAKFLKTKEKVISSIIPTAKEVHLDTVEFSDQDAMFWNDKLPKHYYSFETLLYGKEKNNPNIKSISLSPNDAGKVLEAANKMEVESINILLGILQSSFWNIARMGFMNVVIYEGTKNNYCFLQTEPHSDIYDMLNAVGENLHVARNYSIPNKQQTELKEKWPTFFSDVSVIYDELNEIETNIITEKSSFFQIHISKKLDGMNIILKIKGDDESKSLLHLFRNEFSNEIENLYSGLKNVNESTSDKDIVKSNAKSENAEKSKLEVGFNF